MSDSELALLIIQRFKEQRPTTDWRCLLETDCSICSAFTWCETPEGGEFWCKLDGRIRNLPKFLRENLSFAEEKFVDLQLFI